MSAPPTVLVAAGSDPLAYSGLQADLRHLAAAGCVGLAVPTCLTEQTRERLLAVRPVPEGHLRAAVALALEDGPLAAVKVGLVSEPELARALAEALSGQGLPLVWDPVLATGGGDVLVRAAAADAVAEALLPLATLVTPNLPELRALGGDGLEAAARELMRRGAGAVLVKGGHGPAGPEVRDLLVTPEGARGLVAPRVPGRAPRGTGCALSSLAAAGLARGLLLAEAVTEAHRRVAGAIAAAAAAGTRRLVL